MILSDVVKQNAIRYPQKTGLVFSSVRLTFEDFNRRVNSAANALIGLGIKPGDRVGIILGNCHQYVELYFAVAKAGGVTVPVNTVLTAQEIASILNNAEISMLVYGDEFAPVVHSLLKQLGSAKALVAVGDSTSGAGNYEQLVAQYPSTEPQVKVRESDAACLFYTSGTTGLPKGAVMTHRGMIEITLNVVRACRYEHDDVGLVMTPLFWAMAMMANIMPLFYLGGTVVITDNYTSEAILDLIQSERITSTAMAPPVIMDIIEHPQRSSYDLSTLRCVIWGGVPMPVEAHKRAIQTLGSIFFKAYGLSETGPVSCLVPEEQIIEGAPGAVRRLASCGRPLNNVEVRVVDDEGGDVAPGQVGEVIVSGDNLMTGYWKMPQATEEALKGGYMHTGDLATLDEDGYIYLVGRKKDLIVSGDKPIYAVEVEDVIGQHRDVAEVAVIGVPDKDLGESILAVVVLRKGAKIAAGDIVEFCQQRLPDYACPKSVVFVEILPRNPTGKVLKRVLEERYR